jgi:hypothetical protein
MVSPMWPMLGQCGISVGQKKMPLRGFERATLGSEKGIRIDWTMEEYGELSNNYWQMDRNHENVSTWRTIAE